MACFTSLQLPAGNYLLNSTGKGVRHGTQIYGKDTVDEIQVNGFVKLEGTKVLDHLQVNGCLKAENAKIEEMQVNGQATLDHCFIKQKSVICGALVATSSQFDNELSVSSERVIFNSCVLSSLRILRVGGYQGTQAVELRGKTKINSSIIFESGNGEVIVDSDSEIIGTVIGGKIRK